MPGAPNEQASQGQEATANQGQQQAGQQVQGEGQQAENQGEQHSEMTLEEAQAEIKKLRKENASRRTTSKSLEERLQGMEQTTQKMRQALGIEDEQESPEERLSQLQAQSEMQTLQTEVLGIAYTSGIPPENLEYFQFLFGKTLDGLEEGQELTEEDIDAVVQKAKSFGHAQQGGGQQGRTGTSYQPPNPQNQAQLDAAKFAKMNVGQKSELYEKNPDLYQTLFSEAKTKGLLLKP